ncbi:hypothetical protein L3X38_006501 [Prunus dulcis]|uniref:Amino acid transporter transmembrane domain-containing protein n=1 Tax=Prunus dulcis TaxID=3755 RepID=A0AAD4ZT13_PRUDU|nr:hypothetical protein L3X38_006501 [Prunus dulcis]
MIKYWMQVREYHHDHGHVVDHDAVSASAPPMESSSPEGTSTSTTSPSVSRKPLLLSIGSRRLAPHHRVKEWQCLLCCLPYPLLWYWNSSPCAPCLFTILGWAWGVISLTLAFIWQLYTLWLLVKLHDSTKTGMRYSRYLQLFSATFGDKMAKIFAVFPIYYLSGGNLLCLDIVGGSSMKLFYEIVCGHDCTPSLSPRSSGICVLNALGIISFAFKGHNLTLEIQATMPSSEKKPSHVPMWRGQLEDTGHTDTSDSTEWGNDDCNI